VAGHGDNEGAGVMLDQEKGITNRRLVWVMVQCAPRKSDLNAWGKIGIVMGFACIRESSKILISFHLATAARSKDHRPNFRLLLGPLLIFPVSVSDYQR
jgi:hypothetical protein